MNFIDQWQADRKLQKIVAGLDLENGMTDSPSLTAFDGDDPRLGTYFNGLRRVQSDIQKVSESPESVFLGDINTGRQSGLLTLVRRDLGDRQIPPRMSFGVVLPDVDAVDTEIAVKHLTRLAAANLGITPEDQKPLVVQATKSLKRNRGVLAEADISSKWKLEVFVNNRSGTLTPSLIPVEQPEYSEHWVKRQTGLVKQNIRPEALYKTVMTAAENNYCLEKAPVARVDKIDIDGVPGAAKLAEQQGFELFETENDNESRMRFLIERPRVFRQTGSRDEDVNVRLGINGSWLGKSVEFSAIPSPALKDKIRDAFREKFKPAAGEAISQRIAWVPADKRFINLSPKSFIDPALVDLGHNLEDKDREREEAWLSSLVASALIDELTRYPAARPVADRMAELQALTEDTSTFPHDESAEINFGLNAATMNFILPKSWFQEK